ncbi:MAG: hypothetical protein Q4A71_06060 [Actinomycetaceae bacterium]|nr:hypothetical protein [Actinomycetaceae bacterium]
MRKLLPLALVGVFVLTGCGTEIPKTHTPPGAKEAAPVLGAPQIERIMTALGETLAEGDRSRQAAKLKGRVDAGALAARTGQYATKSVTPIDTKAQIVTVTRSKDWPRAMAAISTAKEGAQALFLRQEKPREPYKLVQWVTLFPNVTIPETAKVETGAPMIGTDGKGLAVAPSELVKTYAAGLADSKKFDDPLLQSLRKEAAQLREATKDGGKVTNSLTPTGQINGIGLHDGGALVSAEFNYSTKLEVKQNSEITLSGKVGELIGGKVTDKGSWTKKVMVMFVIPKKGQAKSVGAQVVLIKAAKDLNN